jgi:hypothetical protein
MRGAQPRRPAQEAELKKNNIRFALVSQQQETYVEGMESLDTVEAFTQKADGAQVPVDPANIITRDAATGLDQPLRATSSSAP